MPNPLDEYLLELILMDSFVAASARHIPHAERIIQSYLPAGLYDRIIARYDQLSCVCGIDDAYLPRLWLRRAARQQPAWKRMMIDRCLHILCAGGCCDASGLAEVATLAHSIGAEQECRQALTHFALHRAPMHPTAAAP